MANIVGDTATTDRLDNETATPIFQKDSGGSDPATLSANIEAFFRALWPNVSSPGNKIGICSWKPTFNNTWFDATDNGKKAAAAMAIDLGEDVYFHVALHDSTESSGRGNNSSARKLGCLWADIDTAESNKSNGKNYPPRAFALDRLEQLPVPPSIIIDSGNGLHAYWLLTEPVDAQEHARLPAAFLAYLRSVFVDKDTGEKYDIDSTADLARVMRVPGTKNSKGGRIVYTAELHTDRRYSVAELARLCPAVRTLPTSTVDHAGIDIVLDQDANPPRAKFEAMMDNTIFARTWNRRRDDFRDPSQSSYDMSLASHSIRAGWSDQESADLLVAHRRTHGQDLKRLDYYQRTIATAHEGVDSSDIEEDMLIDELNQRHAVIHVDRTLVLTEKEDPIFNRKTFVLESKQSCLEWYGNRELNGKKVAPIWFNHAERRQYHGLVFSPSGDLPGYFNMFQGFPIAPSEGDCSRYLTLIKDVICNGNQEHYDYVIKWFAHLFQRPAELPGTALVMRGRQGTGKGTMMKYLGELVGQHYLELVQMGQVTGRFNAHMKDALLVHANEAIWGGDKASEGAIKAMITDETSAVEFKGRDIITVKNYKRLVLASNNDWVAPRDMDDRRFLVLDVTDVHKEDQVYFAALHDQMASGGLEALMHHLLHINLDDFNPRALPESHGAGFDMKLRSMDSVMQWLYEILDAGVLAPDHSDPEAVGSAWPTVIPKATLHGQYTQWCRNMNQRHPQSLPQFARAIKKVLPTLGVSKPTKYGKRTSCFNLPPLTECQCNFEVACKEGPYIWSHEDPVE